MIQLVLMLGGYLALLTIAVWLIGAFIWPRDVGPPSRQPSERAAEASPATGDRLLTCALDWSLSLTGLYRH